MHTREILTDLIEMATREQWYKPNLLYNIHYRPPKKPDESRSPDQSKSQEQAKQPDQLKKKDQPKNSAPPKMVVDTIRFNPSVCTCGKHGCQPHYRMERKVRWVNEEEQNGKATIKENGDVFDCKVGGVEANGKDKEEIGAEVNERISRQSFAADKNDGKTGVEESNGGLGGTFGNEKVDHRSIVKADDGMDDGGQGGGRCAGRVCSDEGDGKRDGKVDYKEGDSRCDDKLSGDKDDRCNGRHSENSDGRFDRDDANGRCSVRTGVDVKESKCYNRDDGCKDNGVTVIDDEVRCDGKFGIDIDNIRYKCKVGFKEGYGGCDDKVMISEHNGRCASGVGGADESDRKSNGAVDFECDDDIPDGRVDSHEVDDVGDDTADFRSLDHALSAGSDSSSVCNNAILEDDTDEIASAFGIMSIYCNSELHSCGRVQDKTDGE